MDPSAPAAAAHDLAANLVAASDYPLLNAFWTMLVFFGWVIWIWLLFVIFGDLFRRDISGWKKAAWIVFVVVLPYIGVLVYLIANGSGMAGRRARESAEAKAQFDDYVRSVSANGSAGGATDEIARGKQLLDSGAITPDEYETLKRRAIAA